MIHIDDSQGEGGRQVLRTSPALSMVTGQPILLDKIRARRPKPGLMRQHLACVTAAQGVSGAQVKGTRALPEGQGVQVLVTRGDTPTGDNVP